VAAHASLLAEVMQVSSDRRKGWNLILFSFLFLTAGVVLLFVSPGSIFVSVALFLACFVLSIFTIANRRFVSGVTMLILVFTVPAVFLIARILNDGGKDIEKGVIKLESEKQK
jgi:hypothetical protein